jgi:transposase
MLTREQFEITYGTVSDACFALITEMDARLSAQQEQIAALTALVKQLQDRLGKDSHNSSKPPSTDGFKKKPVSLRRKAGGKPGGQHGHPGRTLEFCDSPADTVPHVPTHCCNCGTDLSEVPSSGFERRQMHDVPPPPKVECVEHRSYSKCCPNCGTTTKGVLPAGVEHSVQYGPRLTAIILYMMCYQLLPSKRTVEFARDHFGVSLSEGTLLNIMQRAYKTLASIEADTLEALSKGEVIHFDETGVRIAGLLYWLHVICTNGLTYYSCQKRRGRAAMDEIGVLSKLKGRAMHDGGKAYFFYVCFHALCNAHHLRELTSVHEQHGQQWAADMIAVLLDAKAAVAAAVEQGKEQVDPALLSPLENRYQLAIEAGHKANPPPEATGKRGRPKRSVGGNLVRRLDDYRKETLAFLYDFNTPFDNNLAERDVRMMKVKQKVSGCFRSTAGADAFCRIRGYISTMRKQGHDVLDVLMSVCEGNPIKPVTIATA